MAWVRRLPSGLYAATVRLPNGKKLTRSHRMKRTIEDWAKDLEGDIRRGDFIDPRGARITVGEWRERCRGARQREKATVKWEESIWTQHVEPHWKSTRLESILRPDVNKWIGDMSKAGVGAHTIVGAINVLAGLLEQAVDARLIRMNAARGVRRPRLPATVDRIILPAEEATLLASLTAKFGDRPDGRLFVELLLECGLRWEEAAALDRGHVDMRRKMIHVGPVMERDGTIRPYAKSEAGNRPVPVGEELWPRLRDLAMTRPADGLLFVGPRGEPLNYHNWKKRVWNAALVEVERGPRRKIMSRTPLLVDPQPTPHDCRHTFGTRLAEQGVPQHEIGALMGHSPTSRATTRYIHAGEVRFDRARKALQDARGSHAAHDVG